MNTKLSNLSEMANILSVKSSLRADLSVLFSRFCLGHLLCRMSLEKPQGISAVQLILSLCLFSIGGESIHSIYKKDFCGLLETGKNCYYRMMARASMDWRIPELQTISFIFPLIVVNYLYCVPTQPTSPELVFRKFGGQNKNVYLWCRYPENNLFTLKVS